MIPVVAATTPCLASRPVANAFGESFWTMNTFGLGIPASRATSSTTSCSSRASGPSSGLTSRAPVAFRTSLSENQYDPIFMTRAMMSAMIAPAGPATRYPIASRMLDKATSRKTVFTLLLNSRSFEGRT